MNLTSGAARALNGAAQAMHDAVVERTVTLARLESPTGDTQRLKALAHELTHGYARCGGRTTLLPGPHGDHLLVEFPAEDMSLPHLLVVGHYDTVWPAGTLDTWPVTIQDDRLHGPGVLDMKAALALLQCAFGLLEQLGCPAAQPVRVVLVSDEEIGSPHGRAAVEQHLRGAAAVIGLEPPHPDGRVKTARRGSTRLRLTVTGREAHAGLDAAQGISAVDELVDQLIKLRTLIHTRGTAVNAGRIEGGTRANVIAGRAHAELGLRFTTPEAQRTTMDVFRKLRPMRAQATLRTEVLSDRPAWPEQPSNWLIHHVRAIAASLGQDIVGAPAGGAGDTNLPGSLGFPTLDGLGANGAGPHARHEHILLSALAPRLALLTTLLATALPAPDGRSRTYDPNGPWR
ncbi:M20/M25/M40 family metallo-hydrolase [Streptomyces sp. NPDC058623]|uniref:M20/M25/M40 family metallo-hydrolase n=1 Tax=Streptomyces sp. NPDC058623 TaxID=3346563 RepID=UPI003659F28B